MPRLHRLRRPSLSVVSWTALALAVAFAGIAALTLGQAPQATAPLATPALQGPATETVRVRDRACADCGFMKAIRRTDGETGLHSYVFSVRMRDGSVRESSGATRAGWTEGDGVMLIGGPAARALELRAPAVL